jgi:hypothetical protein
MDDRLEPGRDNARQDLNAPAAPRTDQRSLNGRHESRAGQSSFEKPALTERERGERWPVG